MFNANEELILIVCPQTMAQEVVEHLRGVGVVHYTELREALGVGETGRHENTQIWPGENALIFCCIRANEVEDVVSDLKDMHDRHLGHTIGLKIFAWPVRELL